MHPTSIPYWRRIYQYQRERFPVLKTAALVAAFTSSSILMSANMNHRHTPGLGVFIAGFIIGLSFFFQLRVLDEMKDLETDRAYRPERPIPRGLVSLREIQYLGGISVILDIAILGYSAPWALPLLIPVWGWMVLMTKEFWVPSWLHARPMLYMISHMMIMPLMDLCITACEWRAYGTWPGAHMRTGLGYFLGLSFANGCLIEVGRKLWAPTHERVGVDTYSGQYGPARAAMIWIGALMVAQICIMRILIMPIYPSIAAWIIAMAWIGATGMAILYARTPTHTYQQRMDTISGLWVMLSYIIIGYSPWCAHLYSH